MKFLKRVQVKYVKADDLDDDNEFNVKFLDILLDKGAKEIVGMVIDGLNLMKQEPEGSDIKKMDADIKLLKSVHAKLNSTY